MKIKKTKIIKADGRYLVYYEEDKSVKKNKVPLFTKEGNQRGVRRRKSNV